jgi:uncharacterized protein YjiS (DUF1127 family)
METKMALIDVCSGSLNWSGTRFSKSVVLARRWTGFAALSLLAASIVKHRRKQRMFADLQALDDRVLRDIGVTRGEIRYLAYGSQQNQSRRRV